MQYHVDFADIVAVNGSQASGFEELVCQLAEHDYANVGRMYRGEGAGGDGGVETYVILPDNSEWGWQAKYFLDGLSTSRKAQIRNSLKQTLSVHPRCRKWFLALPCNLTPPTGREGESELTWWQNLQREYQDQGIELVLWHKTSLLSTLMRPEHRGRLLYWFGVVTFDRDWFRDSVAATLDQLRSKYQQKLHVQSDVDNLLLASCMGYKISAEQRRTLEYLTNRVEYLGTLLQSAFPERDHKDIRRLIACFRRTLDAIWACVSQTNSFSGRPLSRSEANVVSSIVEQAYERFERRFSRLWAIRDRLAKAYDYGLGELVSSVSPDFVRERDLWDPRLTEYLLEQQGVPYSIMRALQYGSGGFDALRIIEAPEAEESFLEDTWDELYGEAGPDSPLISDDPDPSVVQMFSELDELPAPVPEDEVPVMLEEDINKFEASTGLGDTVTHLDETLLEVWSSCTKLLRSLKSGFVAARSVVHVIAPPGAGKTHLFADVARQLTIEHGKPVLLFTGDLFGPGMSIKSRILDTLGLRNLTWNDFLLALKVAAETNGCKAMIMIDAINESPSVSIWKSNLAAFQALFNGSAHLCLATSCRSTYERYVWPDKEPEHAIRLEHRDDSMDEMVRRYLSNYKLEVGFDSPDSSDLFSNPLYLRLFCEVHGDPKRIGRAKVVTGRDSMFDMFDAFLTKASRAIADQTDQDPTDVHHLFMDLGRLFWCSRRSYIPWSRLSETIVNKFGHQPWNVSVAKALLGEELLLRKELVQGAGFVTMFTYEQLGDYIIAKYGLMRNKKCSASLLKSIPWVDVLNHPRCRAIVEYLALATPRELGQQLWEFVPEEPLFITSIMSAMGQLPPRLIRDKDIAWIEFWMMHGYTVPALRALFECSMVSGSPIPADRVADWRDMIGPERWRKWALNNFDLVDKLVARMDRKRDLNLAVLAWLFYAATRSKRLYSALSNFTEEVPSALSFLRRYTE